jgi:hypothetical protein
VTDEEVGVESGHVTADGRFISWLRDETGSEAGRYVVAPFESGPSEPLAGICRSGGARGSSSARTVSIAAISDADGFAIHAIDADDAVRLLHRHPESVRIAGSEGIAAASTDLAALSADEALLALDHSEHGDMLHPALRVIDLRSARRSRSCATRAGASVAFAWSPIAGDQRLLIGHEREGELRPGIWDVARDEVVELPLPIRGFIEPADWWPDASAILLVQLVDGRHRLHRYELASGPRRAAPTPRARSTACACAPMAASGTASRTVRRRRACSRSVEMSHCSCRTRRPHPPVDRSASGSSRTRTGSASTASRCTRSRTGRTRC